jgi:hypothetical protein
MRWFLGRPRMDSAAAGFAVRVDYPTVGTHEFVGFRRNANRAARLCRACALYYARGPLRMEHSVVVMSLRDFELHVRRRDCRAPDCPRVGGPSVARRAEGVSR